MKHADEKKKAPCLVETKPHYGDAAVLAAYLAEKHADGWELVAVVHESTFIFKALS